MFKKITLGGKIKQDVLVDETFKNDLIFLNVSHPILSIR